MRYVPNMAHWRRQCMSHPRKWMPQWWRFGDVSAAYFPDGPKKQQWVARDAVGEMPNYSPFQEPPDLVYDVWMGRSLKQAMSRMQAHRRFISQQREHAR